MMQDSGNPHLDKASCSASRQEEAKLPQAVILAGGRGTRLDGVAKETPKPLLSISKCPLLEHVVWNLRRHGYERILMLLGYLADRVIDHFGDGARFRARIDYCVEKELLGTGGALKFARDKLDS